MDSSSVGPADTVLLYPGDDPAQVQVLADRIRDGREQLARMGDGISDSRQGLQSAWNGVDASAADQEIGTLLTACVGLVGKLDAAGGAARTHHEDLIGIRSQVDLLREQWDSLRRQMSDTESEFNSTLVWPGAPTELTNGPGSVADVQAHRQEIQARYDQLWVRHDDLNTQYGRLVTQQQASAQTCTSALQAAAGGEWEYRPDLGTAVRGDLSEAFGIAALSFDDRIRAAQAVDNATAEAAWDGMSADEQAFYSQLGKAEFTLPLVLDSKDKAGALWAALDPMAQQALIHISATTIGNTDGIPVRDRSQANIRSMLGDIDRVETALSGKGDTAAYDLIKKTLDESDIDLLGADFVYPDTGMTVRDMKAYLNAVATRDGMSMAGLAANAPTFLWIYQPQQWEGEGRAAFSINDPDTADNVAVLAPGVSNNVSNRMYADDAYNLAAQTSRVPGAGTTAVVNWMGYNAPGGLQDLNAVMDTYARDGGRELAEDVAALRSTDEGEPSHISVFAHSYGSTTTSYALQDGMSQNIDDVAFFGSPGLGEDSSGDAVDSIDDLGMPPGHVFVGMAAYDPISNTADVHDHNPAVSDEFTGATRFQAETMVGTMGAHSVYYAGHFDPNNHWIASESLYNLGNIAVGNGVAAENQAELAHTEFLRGMRNSVRVRVDPEQDREPVWTDMG